MRKKLKQRDEERFRIIAKVERFGTFPGWNGYHQPTILLTDIRDVRTGERLTDHMWFKKGVWSMYIRPGDVISFDARVGQYVKGSGKRDFRMQRPTKVVKHE
jgi:hypothetical protein